jgi:hypothetical protein
MRIALPLLAAISALVALAVFGAVVEAHASPAGPVVELAQAAPTVGPAFEDSFTVSCGATATPIQSSVGTQISFTCQTPASAETGGTVLVAVGDSGIADPAFATRNSPVYSGDTVREWGGNSRRSYCRADIGTVTIFCRALVTTGSAP